MAGSKTPVMKRVYMFGFAASFTDSVACQTAVQQVDSAWLDQHHFLVDRALYSLQLQFHMEHEENVNNPICTIFFDRNPKRLQRVWKKMSRRYQKAEGLRFRTIPAERFRFMAEEWKEIITETDDAVAPTP